MANYDLYVKDIVKYKWSASDNPVKEKSEFKELTLREKVEFIYAVCEYRLDTEDVSEVIKVGLLVDNSQIKLMYFEYGDKSLKTSLTLATGEIVSRISCYKVLYCY